MTNNYREPLLYPEEGTFFCNGCAERLPMDKISDDPRYCRECCIFLLNEYNNGTDRLFPPGWVPKVSPVPPKATRTHCNQNLARKKHGHHPLDDVVVFDGRGAGEKELQPRLL